MSHHNMYLRASPQLVQDYYLLGILHSFAHCLNVTGFPHFFGMTKL